MEVKDDKLSSRILLNMATCHWQVNEFEARTESGFQSIEFAVKEDKGRAKDIVDACDRNYVESLPQKTVWTTRPRVMATCKRFRGRCQTLLRTL